MSALLYYNVGDDTTPDWKEFPEDQEFHFTGAGSTADNTAPIVRPSAGYVWNSETWVGPTIMVGGEKVENWKAPNEAVQAGKVFKVVFDEDTGAAPYITAFDNADFDSWDNLLFGGTEASDWTSLLKAYITGTEAVNVPPPQNWATMETGRSGSMNPNALAGNFSFVTVPFIPTAGDDFTLTMAMAIPHDAEAGKDGKYVGRFAVTYVHV